ncbi:MAG: cation-translocating P-type ATPase [Sphingobacteriales bacterium]|jgi:calcium-translocating P-type ATPase
MSQYWHSLTTEEVLDSLKTSRSGLSEDEVADRQEQYGINLLTKKKGNSVLKLLWQQLSNPLIYVLLVAIALAFLMGKVTDAFVILSVVLINTFIGFLQEWGADRTIRSLMDMAPEFTVVKRNGVQKNIPSRNLVPGDLVLLQAGDKVSADLRLCQVKSFQCEEASLTGESVPVTKTTDPADVAAGIGDRHCMAFAGTLVSHGTAEGIVVKTGMQTEIGKISSLLQETPNQETPMVKAIGRLGAWITIAIILVSLLLFAVAMARNYPFADAALSAITLAVAAIPEGLPAVITIASAIGVKRMAQRKAIIRHLPAVETLGSTTVICSDKTGTLTRNVMTVTGLWTGEKHYQVTDEAILYDETRVDIAHHAELYQLLVAGTLCNDASTERRNGAEEKVGDPTELALVEVFEKLGFDDRQLRTSSRRLDEVPFDSDKKFMATLHIHPNGDNIIYLKGAPEVVLPMTTEDIAFKTLIRQETLMFADRGNRVLAFASKYVNKERISEDDLTSGFRFMGLQAMIDPPRPEVRQSILACQQAGITVKMITGDHPGTALSIGKELGIWNEGQPVYAGNDLSAMNHEAYKQAVADANIFARVSPEHKLKLVEALQANGAVVAMTGDGVNDAPALKRANIGVAMGITGTSAAKEAADMILADDNFQSIRAAVEEGRRVYDNLLKSLVFVLPTSIGLGLVTFIAILIFPVTDGQVIRPILPAQVLWINLITAVALALPLALEHMEPDIMQRPPRQPNRPMFSKKILLRMFMVSLAMALGTVGMFMWEYHSKLKDGVISAAAIAEAQTMSVTAMVLFQVVYLLNCRSLTHSFFKLSLFSNPAVYIGIAVVISAQLLFIYTPFMNNIFGSMPLSAGAILLTFLVALVLFPLLEIEKKVRLFGE